MSISYSRRAYRIEEEKYPEYRFRVKLEATARIIRDFSNAFDVPVPGVKFRRMSRTTGVYFPGKMSITFTRINDDIRFGTIIHEFAHHLNHIKYAKNGHDAHFLSVLDDVYAIAKRDYSGLIESRQDEVRQLQELREKHKEQLLKHREQAKIDAWHHVLDTQSKFRVGQRVAFANKRREVVTGVIYSVNRKSLTVRNCDDGSRGWRVGPRALKLVEA